MVRVFWTDENESYTLADDAKPIGGFSQFGEVYSISDGSDGKWVIKLSRSSDFKGLFGAEYNLLKRLADKVTTRYQKAYTPAPVYWVTEQNKPDNVAIVMPRYGQPLTETVQSLLKTSPLDAEKMVILGAQCYLKVLEVLHGEGKTCIDRKQHDFFLDGDHVVTIDWNVLKGFSDEERTAEVRLTARRFIELTSGRSPRDGDTALPFIDRYWVRSGQGTAGGISVGLRWILIQALNATHPDAFEQFRDRLSAWEQVIGGGGFDEGLFDKANQAERSAIKADLIWRRDGDKADNRDEALEHALMVMGLSPEMVTQLEGVRAQMLAGNSDTARQRLEQLDRPDLTPVDRAAVSRWKSALKVVLASQENMRDENRRDMARVMARLNRDWKQDPTFEAMAGDNIGGFIDLAQVEGRLKEVRTRLKKDGTAESTLDEFETEVKIRQHLLNYRSERDYDNKKSILGEIEGMLGSRQQPIWLDGFNLAEERAKLTLQKESPRLVEAVKQVEAAFEAMLTGLPSTRDVPAILSAVRGFDRAYEAARTGLLTSVPDDYTAFQSKTVEMLVVRDFVESLQRPAPPLTPDSIPRGYNGLSGFDAVKRSPNKNNLTTLANAVLKSIESEQQSRATKYDQLREFAERLDSMDGRISTLETSLKDELKSGLTGLEDRVTALEKPAGISLPLIALVLAALAMVMGVIGIFMGGGGGASEEQLSTLVAQALLGGVTPSAPVIDEQTPTAEQMVETPTETPAPPTETPTPTVTPTPLPVSISGMAVENAHDIDGKRWLIVGGEVRVLPVLTNADGRSVTLNYTLKRGAGTLLQESRLASEPFVYTFAETGDYTLEVTVSAQDDVMPATPLPYQLGFVVVPAPTGGPVALDLEKMTWRYRGLLLSPSNEEAVGVIFTGLPPDYPVKVTSRVLTAAVPGAALNIHGSSVGINTTTIVQLTEILSGDDFATGFTVSGVTPGLYQLEMIDPLQGNTRIGTLTFAVGYNRVTLGSHSQNFEFPSGGSLKFLNGQRYGACGGATYVGLTQTLYAADQPAPVLLSALFKDVTPDALNPALGTVNFDDNQKAVAAPPDVNDNCIDTLSLPGISGPLELTGSAPLPVYLTGETRTSSNVTYTLAYFEAIAPVNLMPTPTRTPTPTPTDASSADTASSLVTAAPPQAGGINDGASGDNQTSVPTP